MPGRLRAGVPPQSVVDNKNEPDWARFCVKMACQGADLVGFGELGSGDNHLKFPDLVI